MNDIVLKKLFVNYAKIEKIKLDFSVMKEENIIRFNEGQSYAYGEEAFSKQSNLIGEIITQINNEIENELKFSRKNVGYL